MLATPSEDERSSPLRAEVGPRPITIGILLDGSVQERWVLDCVSQALAVSGVRLKALAIASARPRQSFAVRLHHLFDKLDAYLRCWGEQRLAPVDVAAELALPPFHVDVIHEGSGWRPNEAGIATLQRCEVDLWLCFADVPPHGLPRSVSRLGIWGIEIGEGVAATNVWAGAVELSAASPVTMVTVVDYTDVTAGPLYRSFVATATSSPRRNRLGALRQGMSFFKRLLERLTRQPDAWRSARPATLAVPEHYPARREPTVSGLVRLSRHVVSNVVASRWRSLRWLDQWQVAYCFADEGEVGCRLERLRYLVPPKDRFWADPFAIERQGRYFILFEELLYRTEKGHLAAIEVFEDAEPGEAQVILEQPYHLSYPFIFDWEGALHMIPETAQNRTVEVYRCEAFPHRWHLRKVLLDNVNAVDATLWRGEDRWWMFVNVAPPGVDPLNELHLFWSGTPLGPWAAHRGNPVVSDVRCARSAGPLFSRNGTLYRPSQDCSVAYGHSVLINRVDVLREDAYQETAVDRIGPGWRKDALRVHTVGGGKRLRVIDCMMRR